MARIHCCEASDFEEREGVLRNSSHIIDGPGGRGLSNRSYRDVFVLLCTCVLSISEWLHQNALIPYVVGEVVFQSCDKFSIVSLYMSVALWMICSHFHVLNR